MILILAISAAPAQAAKPKAITGKLNIRGFTVIAVSNKGKVTTVAATTGKFRIRPPSKFVTLHLRARDGSYGGPIVLGSASRGKRAIVGVKAGAKLGKIRYIRSRKYAKVVRLSKRSQRRFALAKGLARAKRGIPIGAGNFGLVNSKSQANSILGDRDLDGVADPLDVDVDGDLIIDEYDNSAGARASAVGDTFPGSNHMSISTGLLTFDFSPIGAANANGGSSDAQIAASQVNYGTLNFFWNGLDPNSGELDCGLLVYCRLGGTGVLPSPTNPIFRSQGSPYPACCDSDGDGLGSLVRAPGLPGSGGPDSGGMSLYHGATVDQIGTGDVIIQKGTVNGVPTESAETVGFVFSTPPVIAAYDDGQGESGRLQYPLPSPIPNISVKDGPSGDTIMSFKIWRPQRRRVAGEPGTTNWTDMGHLLYMTSVFVSGTEGNSCPQSSFSESDADLEPTLATPYAPFPNAGGFTDVSADHPPDPANTLDFTINISQCLAANGGSFDPGDVARVNIHAFSYGGGQLADARSDVPFQRVP